MTEKSRAHLVIHGLVQGVAYRYNTKMMADRYQVNGWVKNLPNGNVEAVLEGDKANIDNLITWCEKGPSMAAVSKVDVDREPFANEFSSFDIVH